MREKIVKLAKQAGKLLAIELFVPGGTLVVLAILLARGPVSWISSRFAGPFQVQTSGEHPARGDAWLSAGALRIVPRGWR